MERLNRVVLNLIFCIQVLLIFLLFVESRIDIPAWLQVAGRMHPLVLHVPIGAMVFLTLLILFQKQLGQVELQPVFRIGLMLTSLSASLAALFGFFLSLQSDYGADALMRHKVGGVLLSCLCYAALLWYNSNRKKSVFIAIGAISIITLIFAGHTGAVLTHGDNFLLAPISRPSIVLTAENSSLYHFAVEPILERKCFTCHNETKAKGGLIMTTPEKFRAGGDSGAPWIPGNPSESRMIEAFYLPLSDDKHMPPDGKPQLTPVEIAALNAWIKSGADFEKKLDQYEENDSLRLAIASVLSSQLTPVVEEVYTFDAAPEAVVNDLNTPYRTVLPLYQNSPALQADFFVRTEFEEKALNELSAVDDQLVVLNLSKMPITDKDLSTIKSFTHLEHLNLNFSAIDGDGLKELESLKNLRSISLAGTAVRAHHLAPLLALPELRAVYVWSTHVSDGQRDSLGGLYPRVKIVSSEFEDNAILRLSKPLVDNEGIMGRDESLVLRHPMPGVTIRYTLDGTEPDTLTGLVFDKPLPLKQTALIKARACKDTWYCSSLFQYTCFVDGIKPRDIELLSPPDPIYPGEGAISLYDGKKGLPDVLKEPSWLGYRNNKFEAGVTFDSKVRVSNIVVSYGKNLGAYCFPPRQVEVWAGTDINHLKLIKSMTVDQPSDYEPLAVEGLSIPLEPSGYSYYKIVATPLEKIPSWHKGKGEKVWFFIDELFLYE